MNNEEINIKKDAPKGPPHMRLAEKPKDFKTSMVRLFKELKDFKILLIIAALFSIITTTISIYTPNVIKDLTDEITKGLFSVINMDNVKNIVIFLIVIYLANAIMGYIDLVCMSYISNKFGKSLRTRISNKINKLPLSYFDKNRSGDTLSRVTNDIDTITQSMNQSLGSLFDNSILLVGTLIMMFITNIVLAFTAVFASIIGFVGMFIILSKSQKYFKDRQSELGKLNSHIEEAYQGLNIVKLYNGKKDSIDEFNKLNNKVKTANFKSQFLSGIMMPLMVFVGNFGYVAVCVVGAILTMNGSITFGVIVAFMTYVRMFTSPLQQIAQGTTAMQSCAAASERVFEFLDECEMDEEKNINKKLLPQNIKGNIEFKNVIFTYDGNDIPTITNFNATCKSGQKIAIVGPTGAGKTTIVNLLMKFYNIDSGDILIDGVSINDIKRENVHDLFTMVLQDTWLFEGTIKENIIFNRKNVTQKEIEDVCKKIGLDYFIKTLPNGYNSMLSETDTLSQGQKQLLTIARAMINKTPFLILDEATSNVDTRTEELVQKAMDKLAKGRTSFIIAHRLSTIKNADLILVMDNGNIIEQGNHNELMNKNGFYAKLYNSQFEL